MVDGLTLPLSLYADGGVGPNVRIGPLVARAFIAVGEDGLASLVFVVAFPDMEIAQDGFEAMKAARLEVCALEEEMPL